MSMDAGDEAFKKKLPFHMVFPFSDNIDMEEEDERDSELLKHLYPEAARRLWPEVEEVCLW